MKVRSVLIKWVIGMIFPCFVMAGNKAPQAYDVVVYGGTASGVMAAVTAAREGLKVAILEPKKHLGGMVSGGLSATDLGRKDVIGGYAKELYQRCGKYYGLTDTVAWFPEPHVAEKILNDMVKEANVAVFILSLIHI